MAAIVSKATITQVQLPWRSAWRGVAALAAVAVIAMIVCGATVPELLPDLTLRSSQGETVRLTDLRGDVAVILFWSADCRSCMASREAFARLNNQFAARGVRILAISEDPSEQNWRKWLIRNPSAFVELQDKNHAASKALRCSAGCAIVADRSAVVRSRYRKWDRHSLDSATQSIERLLTEKKRE